MRGGAGSSPVHTCTVVGKNRSELWSKCLEELYCSIIRFKLPENLHYEHTTKHVDDIQVCYSFVCDCAGCVIDDFRDDQ